MIMLNQSFFFFSYSWIQKVFLLSFHPQHEVHSLNQKFLHDPVYAISNWIEMSQKETQNRSCLETWSFIRRLEKKALNFNQKQNCKMKLFLPFFTSFSVVKFSLCWFFFSLFFFLFYIMTTKFAQRINSGLCLLSTYIQKWTPPSYADPTFRSRSRCRCPVNWKRIVFKILILIRKVQWWVKESFVIVDKNKRSWPSRSSQTNSEHWRNRFHPNHTSKHLSNQYFF